MRSYLSHVTLPLITLHFLFCSLCIWKIIVPENKIILIKFTSLYIENQVECDHDYVSLQSSNGVLISEYASFVHLSF